MKESKVAGRVAVYVPEHPAANNRGYILKSRYVMEQHLGRGLRSEEEVHHKNEDVMDDRLDNLEVLTTAEHASHYKPWLLAAEVMRTIDRAEVKRLMDLGLGNRKIAARLGASTSRIKNIMKRFRA